MRHALTYVFFGIVIAAACGGRTTDPDTGTGGSGGSAGSIGTGGGTTVGGTGGGTTVGGTGGGTTVGGTGGGTTVGGTTSGTGGGTTVGGTGGTGNTGGSGGAGGAGGTVDFGACSGQGQCALVPTICCFCGQLDINRVEAINATYRDTYKRKVCEGMGPCPECVGSIDPYLMARCESGRCRKVDIRTDPTYTKCGTDQECILRKGLGCCTCNADSDWVAISRVGEMLITSQTCGSGTVCPTCIPVPPTGTSAVCRNGACTKVP